MTILEKTLKAEEIIKVNLNQVTRDLALAKAKLYTEQDKARVARGRVFLFECNVAGCDTEIAALEVQLDNISIRYGYGNKKLEETVKEAQTIRDKINEQQTLKDVYSRALLEIRRDRDKFFKPTIDGELTITGWQKEVDRLEKQLDTWTSLHRYLENDSNQSEHDFWDEIILARGGF